MHGVTGVKTGSGTNDNDVLITLLKIEPYDTFMVMSTAGAVDVEVTLDGTNWSGPISLADLGGTSTDPVLVTVAGRLYGFRGKFAGVRVLQNGATAASASLRYGIA